MTVATLIKLFKDRWPTIVLMGLLVASISFWSAMLFSGSFKGRSDILIMQNQEGFVDYYALSKSAEYLSKVLTESIYSESFLEEINKTNLINLDTIVPVNKSERLKKWEKIVRVKRKADTGVLSIEVLGNNSREVEKISQALLNVVTNKGHLFLGRGQNLGVKVLSGPIVEKRLSGGDVVLICLGGFLMGVFFFGMFFYYSEESKKNISKKIYSSTKNTINLLKEREQEEMTEEPKAQALRETEPENKSLLTNVEPQVATNNEKLKRVIENKEPTDKEIELRLNQLLKQASQNS